MTHSNSSTKLPTGEICWRIEYYIIGCWKQSIPSLRSTTSLVIGRTCALRQSCSQESALFSTTSESFMVEQDLRWIQVHRKIPWGITREPILIGMKSSPNWMFSSISDQCSVPNIFTSLYNQHNMCTLMSRINDYLVIVGNKRPLGHIGLEKISDQYAISDPHEQNL